MMSEQDTFTCQDTTKRNLRKEQNTLDNSQSLNGVAATSEHRDGRHNENDARNPFSIVHIMLIIIIAIVSYWYIISSPKACDMKIAENRDLNKYCGIIGLKNHFTTPATDQCDVGIIFKLALPQAILKSDHSASSFLTLARYGTGKTLLKCEYSKSLKSDKYLKILVLNKQISEYIDRFVTKNLENEKDCENKNCLHGWTENEFGQLILSTLVTEFINAFQHEQIKLTGTSIEDYLFIL